MSRKAMKLAQKAIEAHNSGDWDTASELFDEALPALRKALANEALDRVSENARELGLDYGVEQDLRVFARVDAMRAKGLLKLTAALEQPAQQEPVAIIASLMPAERHTLLEEGHSLHDSLYTSPPAQRKPLTDEVTDRCIEAADTRWADAFVPIQWARHFKNAIEAAHDIKGDA